MEELYRDFKKLLLFKLDEIAELEAEIIQDMLSDFLEVLKDE